MVVIGLGKNLSFKSVLAHCENTIHSFIVGDDYDAIKNTIGEMMVEQLCKLYPQVRDHIDYKGQKISKAFLFAFNVSEK